MGIGMNAQPGNPIVSTWVSQDGHFAFCEFRSIEETNSALLLNGLQLLGQSLRVGRPKSYQGPAAPAPTLSALNNIGGAAGLVSQNPQMAALAQLVNLQSLSETEVKDILSPFGEISQFEL